MADLDGDGENDIVSGSYAPGNFTFFRGLGGGRFAAGELLQDDSDRTLNAGWAATNLPDWLSDTSYYKRHPQSNTSEGIAVSSWLVDFDADGDLDLLAGNIYGRVILMRNVGDPKRPAFATGVYLFVDHTPIRVEGDAGPTTADWDGDGLWDLIVGSNDGGVYWYRNIGTAKEPRFAASVALIGPLEGWTKDADASSLDRSQGRAKVHCVDWNGDGRLDLLVGDISLVKELPGTPPEDAEKLRQLEQERTRLETRKNELTEKQANGTITEEERTELANARTRLEALYGELGPLKSRVQTAGWVWVYLRKAG